MIRDAGIGDDSREGSRVGWPRLRSQQRMLLHSGVGQRVRTDVLILQSTLLGKCCGYLEQTRCEARLLIRAEVEN